MSTRSFHLQIPSTSSCSSEMLRILISYPYTVHWHHLMVFMHELAVRVRQLASVAQTAQLVRVLHRNRRAAGSIPAREPIVAFFATAPG